MKLYAKPGQTSENKLVYIITFLLLILSSTSSYALNQKVTKGILKDLFIMRIHSFLAINAYYNYSVSKGDKSLLSEVNNSIKEIDRSLKELTPAVTDETKKYLGNLDSNWRKYRKLLKINLSDMKRQGYPDLRMVDNMSQQNIKFTNLLDSASKKIATLSDYKIQPVIRNARIAALNAALMMTRYTARSTASNSQDFQGAVGQLPIDKLARLFDKNLKDLIPYEKNNPKTKNLINSVQTKWEFIRNSYIHYKQNNVNYIANLYSEKIIRNLIDLASIKGS